MTGNRATARAANRPYRTVKDTAPHNYPHTVPGASIVRRPGSASRPSRYAVDLRSSLDPDPLPAFVSTEPGNGTNRSRAVRPKGLTAPLLSGMTAEIHRWSTSIVERPGLGGPPIEPPGDLEFAAGLKFPDDEEFPADDEACLTYLWRTRFAPDGDHAWCPRCRLTRVFRRYRTTPQRRSWTCTACGCHLYPTAGTVFEKSSTGLRLWFQAARLVASSTGRISAAQLVGQLGVSYKTAWRMKQKLLEQASGTPASTPAFGAQSHSVAGPGDANPRDNLPSLLTRFVGRRNDIRLVRRLVGRSRLLTLVGSGGCGKTRLALHVATALRDVYTDGVWWVDLARLSPGQSVCRRSG